MGSQWRELRRGVLGATRPALVTTLARHAVLHSLELDHVRNCDTKYNTKFGKYNTKFGKCFSTIWKETKQFEY